MPFLLTLALVALATPAAAQISAGPMGPFAVVDSTGRVVGGLVDFEFPFNDSKAWTITINTPGGSGAVRWQPNGNKFVQIARIGGPLFAEPDCTGQAYIYEYMSSPTISGKQGLFVSADSVLYEVSGLASTATFGSILSEGAVCSSGGSASSQNLIPVTEIGDLAAEFTAPFHLVTVASLPKAELPSIASPTPGATLSGTSQNFSWIANTSEVGEWWLYAGSSEGESDYYDSENLFAQTTATVTSLPADGSPVYMRLWYRADSTAGWESVDAQFTAAVIPPPSITSPVPESVLSGDSQSFAWSDNGTAVEEWWLYVGASLGGDDYYDSGSLGVGTSATAMNLPSDGTPVFVRLWHRPGSGARWEFVDAEFTAAPMP